jgi:multiple sugar transport system substrate-binding protein
MPNQISRRTLIGAGLGAGILAPLLAGCSPIGSLVPASSGGDTLVVHSQFSGAVSGSAVFAEVVRNYRNNFNAQIATVTNGSDLPIVFETSVLAGKEADIAIINMVGKSLAWTSNGATIPVQRYLTEWGLDARIAPGAIEEWSDADGNLRAFPYTRTNWPVAFNNRLLEQAGVSIPTTSDELIAATDALRSIGVGPVAIGGGDWTGQKLFMQIIQSFMSPLDAVEVFSSGKISESAAAIAGITHFVELRDAGVFVDSAQGFTSDSMLTQYNTGKAGIMSSMSSALALVPADRAAETTIGGWPLPSTALLTKPTIIQSFNGMGIWISERGAQKLDLVEPFIKYLFSDEVISQFILESGRDMNAVTDVTSTDYPLVAQAQALSTSDAVDPVILPDLLIPDSAFEPLTQATASAYGNSVSVERVVDLVESAYRNA